MIIAVYNYDWLEEFTKDILSLIKPTEEDQNKRLGATKEIVNLVDALRGFSALRDAAVKPFGSFVSNLYAKSGDLDVSVQLSNDSGFPTSKNKKKKTLLKLGRALEKKGVARDVQFILTARVPVLKYVSNHYGISCDISIDNYPGRIKSRALYWVSTIDDRFGDMVLLVKEWARAQNINDPKNGTLNSYTLCLLVISHFQHCTPAILPPMKEIFYASIAKGSGGGFNEKHFDQTWEENVAKFRRQREENIGQRNKKSLSYLLATFFETFSVDYADKLNQTKEMTKSSCRIVDDPFDRSDDAAIITVDVAGFWRIASAFTHMTNIIYHITVEVLGPDDRNELFSMLSTPEVCSKVGGKSTADRYTNPEMCRQQHIHTGPKGSGPIRRTQGYNSGKQSAAPYWRRQRRGQQN